MDSILTDLSLPELNAAALEQFIYLPVSDEMITYLADAAANVIQCDPNMMPVPAGQANQHSAAGAAMTSEGALPPLDVFIHKLVKSSNVQVPTLMSTLVYLHRLKARLQPMAKGLRCTTHRIFLAALILAAKYLNDSSPKNKHWANYSVINDDEYEFGFNRTEVNLMEKQLLYLLEWDLRITQDDLYRELDHFLAPIRYEIEVRHAHRMRKQAEKQRRRMEEEERAMRMRQLHKEQQEPWTVVYHQRQYSTASVASAGSRSYITPPSSRGNSRSRHVSPTGSSSSGGSSREVSPPGLSSSRSSYAGSNTSRATTPLSEVVIDQATGREYIYSCPEIPEIYNSPEEVQAQQQYMAEPPLDIVIERPSPAYPSPYSRKLNNLSSKQLLPYEISAEDLRSLQEDGGRVKRMRGMLGRVFGGNNTNTNTSVYGRA
ncbi:cyclin-U4-1 [Diplogelasinospora grovesii]|uniref:Cyclin-U4-1 n=1 Tax=Diplogelasinospora grovesii TaxID=303347 RepID=A0AAN6NBY9_9PEZI|nr:cyclin-U4-1 [Diplogelasinospora grovesii]